MSDLENKSKCCKACDLVKDVYYVIQISPELCIKTQLFVKNLFDTYTQTLWLLGALASSFQIVYMVLCVRKTFTTLSFITLSNKSIKRQPHSTTVLSKDMWQALFAGIHWEYLLKIQCEKNTTNGKNSLFCSCE